MKFHNITKDDMLNGEGLRVVLWVSGCEHGCPGCHNAITWDAEEGIVFDKEALEEISRELEKDYISGMTLSGGDPLYPANREEIFILVKTIKQNYPQKTIWLYTGYCWEEIQHLPGLEKIDVLVDGRYLEKLRDTKLHWRGSSNQRVIDVFSSLKQGKVILYPCGKEE